MATDYIVEKFKEAVLYKLEKVERIAFDDSLYAVAKEFFCLRRRRVEKGINELVDEGKIKLVASSNRYARALDIVLAVPVKQ